MRQLVIAALVLSLAAVLASADTIYLKGGQIHQGKVGPAKNGKVVLETSTGNVEVEANDIILVVPSSTIDGAAGAASAPSGVAVDKLLIPTEGRRALPMDQMTNPEPVIFTLMRTLAVTPPGTETFNLRQQVELWRATAHDRKRKAQFEWILPAEFSRRRQLYLRTLKEGEDLFRKIRFPSPSPGVDPNAERRRLMVPVYEKLDAAAHGWADPLLRYFLSGLSAMERDDYPQGESFFRKCLDEEPLVAAFHQGRAAAQIASGHPLWGLEELMAALQLRPDSRELISEIQQAMKKAPGTAIKDPVFVEAQRLMSLYSDNDKRSYTSSSPPWVMPGKDWPTKAQSLPTPPYDRLVFRQAMGAPIGVNTLLVDSSLLKDSAEVYVRIDANTIAPAYFRKISASGKTPPLATLTVPGFEFTVPKIIEDPNAMPAEAPMTAHAVAAWSEMGSLVRKATGKLGGAATTDGSISVTGTLLPGEAAAPVFAGEGTLIGFLAGKTDIGADNGGPDRFIPLSQFSQILRTLKTAVPDQSMYGRLKRTPSARPAPGESFIVTGIVTETLE